MRTQIGGCFLGLALGLGLFAGLGGAGAPGQPTRGQSQAAGAEGAAAAEPALPDDPVERELALIRLGLFRDQSELPQDPARSIEQMLEEQSRLLRAIEARLGSADGRRLHEIEKRLDSFEQKHAGAGATDTAPLDRDLREMRRLIDDLDKRVKNVPESDLGQLARTVQELERRMNRDAGRAIDSLETSLRSAESTIRSLESRVRTLERKTP